MEGDLSNYRKAYVKNELDENKVPANPMELFQSWFYEVEQSNTIDEANAMTLSTIGKDSYPKGRVVLLKKFTYEGFIFYTNYQSEKGESIKRNNKVCLSFFWHAAERQIIIKGKAEKIAENLSDGYFETRPKGSQLGALISNQSQPIPNRQVLEDRLKAAEQEYDGKEVPRPEHWGGFIVKPVEIEFWQGRANRLHDRIRYQLTADLNWNIDRLSP